MWDRAKKAAELIGRVWDKALTAGSLKDWAIIMGAPPLCALTAWVIHILSNLAVQPEPVRIPIVMAIANMGYLTQVTVLTIVAALAAVSLVVRGPGGWQVGVNDDEESKPTVVTTTTETVVTQPKEAPRAEPQLELPFQG